MMQSLNHLIKAVVPALLFTATMAVAQLPESPLELELAEYQDNLAALESDYGYSDPALLETLDAIAARLMELGQFAAAHSALDRAQQLVRYQEGLYSLSQLPYIHRKIQNWTAAGNWADARTLQDHLFWLYTERYPYRDPELIAGLMQGVEYHLQGVLADDPEYSGYHYRAAAIHSRIALHVGETIWAPNDRRLAPLYYDQMRHAYLSALAIRRGGPAGTSLRSRATVYGYDTANGFMLDEEVAIGLHRATGFRYLEQLKFLFNHPLSADPEAAAMVTLYEADWQVLFRRYDEALANYARASEELIAAGVAPEQVDKLLANPVLIPEAEFHTSVDAALGGRNSQVSEYLGSTQALPMRMSFNLPSTVTLASIPEFVDDLGLVEDDATVFVFRLPGEEGLRRSFWQPRHYSLGAAQDIQLLDQGLSDFGQQEELMENLSWLRFRPSFNNGGLTAVQGILGYMFRGN
ncbi:MAG: hypothetical protein RL120_19380 [Gammaproteobacteria bacterium]